MKRQQNVKPSGGNMSESKQMCVICGESPGRGLKNCPGCSPQAIAAKVTAGGDSRDTQDDIESSLNELYEASTKVEDLSKTAFALSIAVGLVGVVLGFAAWFTLAPGEGEEGSNLVGPIAGFTIFGIFLIQAVIMALVARYAQMRAIQVRANN